MSVNSFEANKIVKQEDTDDNSNEFVLVTTDDFAIKEEPIEEDNYYLEHFENVTDTNNLEKSDVNAAATINSSPPPRVIVLNHHLQTMDSNNIKNRRIMVSSDEIERLVGLAERYKKDANIWKEKVDKKKRERSKNFLDEEKHNLMEIALNYKVIIENKRTDAVSIHQKVKTWEEIAQRYNNSKPKTGSRTGHQLKMLYDTLKRTVKKFKADDKVVEENKTVSGEVQSTLPHTSPFGLKILGVLGQPLDGMLNDIDAPVYTNNSRKRKLSEKDKDRDDESSASRKQTSIIDIKERELELEERKLALEERRIELEKQKFELEKKEREQRLQLERQEREANIKIIDQQQQFISLFLKDRMNKS